jgi:hypothetical protein
VSLLWDSSFVDSWRLRLFVCGHACLGLLLSLLVVGVWSISLFFSTRFSVSRCNYVRCCNCADACDNFEELLLVLVLLRLSSRWGVCRCLGLLLWLLIGGTKFNCMKRSPSFSF